MSYNRYERVQGDAPPQSMTMSRLSEMDELVVAQSTQLCFQEGFCRPSINWVLLEASNFEPGSNPFDSPNVGGWIHEESTFFQRCFLAYFPGCRETKFVHHTSLPPNSLSIDNRRCCTIQTTPTSEFLSPQELEQDIVAVHKKDITCISGSCCYTPYLRTIDGEGRYLGETQLLCDKHIFIPKFIVLDQYRRTKYLLRPDTCCLGMCVLPRCNGNGGKCCRLPFLVRDPRTYEPITSNIHEGRAQVTELWSGLINEALLKRHAYHVAFPVDASADEKLVLVGSSILVDVAYFERDHK